MSNAVTNLDILATSLNVFNKIIFKSIQQNRSFPVHSYLICQGVYNHRQINAESIYRRFFRSTPTNFCETGGFPHILRIGRIQCELTLFVDRAVCLCSQSRSPWHEKYARALIEFFVQNRTQLLRLVIQSGTMFSQPDTSLSRNACGCVY